MTNIYYRRNFLPTKFFTDGFFTDKVLESAKLHALRAKDVLTCQRALRAYVVTWKRAFHAYVLTWQHTLRAYFFTCQCALRAYALTCQRALRALVFKCQHVLRAYVLTSQRGLGDAHVPTCLESLASNGLHDNVITCRHALSPQ